MSRQTCVATAYLRMLLMGLAGMRPEPDGVRFQPCIPEGISRVELRNLGYRGMRLDITISGSGTKLRKCLVNGAAAADGLLDAAATGRQQVSITVGP